MTITDVRVKLQEVERLRAFVNVTIDGDFVVRGLKIIYGPNGYFVSMPSRKQMDGTHRDICHPINNHSRETLEQAVLRAYEEELKRNSGSPQQVGGRTDVLGVSRPMTTENVSSGQQL